MSDEALTHVEREVEGWAVGLRLVSLALRHVGDPDAFLRGLPEQLPEIQEYLLRPAGRRPRPGDMVYLRDGSSAPDDFRPLPKMPIDRRTTLTILRRLARTSLGEHLILGGSSGLHAVSEEIPALTEDVDLLIDAEWVEAHEDQLLSEMA